MQSNSNSQQVVITIVIAAHKITEVTFSNNSGRMTNIPQLLTGYNRGPVCEEIQNALKKAQHPELALGRAVVDDDKVWPEIGQPATPENVEKLKIQVTALLHTCFAIRFVAEQKYLNNSVTFTVEDYYRS